MATTIISFPAIAEEFIEGTVILRFTFRSELRTFQTIAYTLIVATTTFQISR